MSAKKNYALSAYPLSHEFQINLSSQVNEPIDYFQLAGLRQKKIIKFIKFMHALNVKKFFIVLEDPDSQTLLPILQLITQLANPQQIIVVYSDHTFRTIKFNEVLLSICKLIKATIINYYSYFNLVCQGRALIKKNAKNFTIDLSSAQRILYLNTNLWFGVKAGGSLGHIAGVVNALANKGFGVDYFSVDNSMVFNPEVDNIQLSTSTSFGMPAELNYYHFNSLVIRQLMKQNIKWDFIYQRLSIANFSGVVLSRKFNIPLVIEYNGSEVWIAKNWGKQLRYHKTALLVEQICLQHAHFVMTISDVLVQELLERGVPQDKIIFYPNCIDPKIFSPDKYTLQDITNIRAKYQISSSAILFTFVGTFGQWHGVEILARAIKLLVANNKVWLEKNNIHFLLVGDGMKMKEVQALIGDKSYSQYVTLTGLVPQDQAPYYLAASNVLLSPHVANKDGTRFFGSPTKLFEYMAMAKPIIASDLEQIGEVLSNSLRVKQLPSSFIMEKQTELALLCEPGDVTDLINAIIFLTEHPQWRAILGRNAQKEALRKYTWDKHVTSFLKKK